MRILIIGSKGFIGSHLADYFSKDPGNKVYGCDIKEDTGEPDYFQVEKLNSDYNRIFSLQQFDVCIFAGGNGSVPFSIKFPEIDYQLNTHAINEILESIRINQAGCKFIHLSSAAVYGSVETLPIIEDHQINPLSPYGWNKNISEIICRKFSSLYNIPTISLRIFSVFGQGLQKQLFWDLYEKIRVSKNVILYGTGQESRDFIHISDLVKAIDLLIRKAEFKAEVYNVASGIETTIKEATGIFSLLYDSDIKINFGGEIKAGDPINWRADIGKIKQMGFRATTDLNNGLQQYIQWLREKELR